MLASSRTLDPVKSVLEGAHCRSKDARVASIPALALNHVSFGTWYKLFVGFFTLRNADIASVWRGIGVAFGSFSRFISLVFIYKRVYPHF